MILAQKYYLFRTEEIMKYCAKDIAVISLVAALTVVLGYVFYAIGRFFPIPGHKFMIFAPFLGFIMFIPASKTKKIGVMTVFSFVFAFIMTHISFVMALAIIMAGITADLITLILFHNYKKTWKIIALLACTLLQQFYGRL